MAFSETMAATAGRPVRHGSPTIYQVSRAGLIWRWRTATGVSGWAFTRGAAKRRAVAAIQRQDRRTGLPP